MLIERELLADSTGEAPQHKTRSYVWCNISTAIKQSFVAHQFRFYEGAAYNTSQTYDYLIDEPVSEEL